MFGDEKLLVITEPEGEQCFESIRVLHRSLLLLLRAVKKT
jgi:hypothetical protein